MSRHPEAVRSRRRRRAARRRDREEVGVADQRAFEREERRALARAVRDKDERFLAERWLGDVRDVVAQVFRCSLSLSEAVSSSAEDEGVERADRQRENMRTPWLVVGRFDPLDPIGYADLATAMHLVERDLALEAAIHPQRMSQIRVVYADPNSRRGEGDSVVSKIGAWTFVAAELAREVGGFDDDDPDALANRYQATRVVSFYVYFSAHLQQHRTPWFSWRPGV